jgi:hypothetical protein
LGFARLEGDYPNWTGRDRFESGSRGGSGSNTGKSYAILDIDGDLYSFVTPASGTRGYASFTLKKSTNGASSWQNLYTFQRGEGPGDGFIKPAFLQFGRGYQGARDQFVYAYVIENTTRQSELSIQRPGRVYLLRCPISGLASKSNWQAFTSNNPANPTWGGLKQARPVFTDSRGVGWNLSCIYNLGLKRYILCTEYGESFKGQFQFHDAPEPWGPWQKIQDVNFSTPSFYLNFSQKWMRDGGRRFVALYTGIGGGLGGDALTTIEGRFEVSAPATNGLAPFFARAGRRERYRAR